jgi:hypothetical protein
MVLIKPFENQALVSHIDENGNCNGIFYEGALHLLGGLHSLGYLGVSERIYKCPT